jgi:hypothetical protein
VPGADILEPLSVRVEAAVLMEAVERAVFTTTGALAASAVAPESAIAAAAPTAMRLEPWVRMQVLRPRGAQRIAQTVGRLDARGRRSDGRRDAHLHRQPARQLGRCRHCRCDLGPAIRGQLIVGERGDLCVGDPRHAGDTPAAGGWIARLATVGRSRPSARSSSPRRSPTWHLHDLWPELARTDPGDQRLEAEIAELVGQVAAQLLDEPGFGPLTAAKLVGEIAGAARFASDAKLARAAGLAPIPVIALNHAG